MSTDIRKLLERGLQAFEAKDLPALSSIFADDALFYDPHYPLPDLQGKTAIAKGFEHAFGMIKQPAFNIRNFWSNGQSGVAEVDTHHVLQNGSEVRFPQVFVIEIKNDLITRFQVYAPYPPPPSQ
jgi:hypothetical protein